MEGWHIKAICPNSSFYRDTDAVLYFIKQNLVQSFVNWHLKNFCHTIAKIRIIIQGTVHQITSKKVLCWKKCLHSLSKYLKKYHFICIKVRVSVFISVDNDSHKVFCRVLKCYVNMMKTQHLTHFVTQ